MRKRRKVWSTSPVNTGQQAHQAAALCTASSLCCAAFAAVGSSWCACLLAPCRCFLRPHSHAGRGEGTATVLVLPMWWVSWGCTSHKEGRSWRPVQPSKCLTLLGALHLVPGTPVPKEILAQLEGYQRQKTVPAGRTILLVFTTKQIRKSMHSPRYAELA